MKRKQNDLDPAPYDGPIERADGVRPFNMYLWPSESWWANQDLGCRYSSRFHFGYVALADGRFSTSGFVWAIEKNESFGRPCLFSTRAGAIRSDAARLIRLARASRKWGNDLFSKGVQGRDLARLINWVLELVARETGGSASRIVRIDDPPPPVRKTGYPLFDSIFPA